VLIHQDLHGSCSCNRDNAQASKFLAAWIAVFTASLCYAKIAPAALHRGEFESRRRDGAEALGGNRKFELGDFPRAATGAAMPIAKCPGWHQVKQTVPDA
jgi:hypothetical protein